MAKVEPDNSTAVAVLPRPQGSFLPVIDRPLDNTAMTVYKTCPREYLYSMVRHRRGDGRSPALVFGSAWHKAMEWHYKTGGDRERVVYEVTMSWEGHNQPDDYRTMERVILDYDRYVEKYGRESGTYKDEGAVIGAPELVEVATSVLVPGLLHPWTVKLDLFRDIDGMVWIEDHKTTSRLDKHYFKQFWLSNQMKGYTATGKQLIPGRIIAGVRINLAHVLTHKTEFHRQSFPFNPEILQEWAQNENVWLKRLARDYELLQAGDPDAFPGHYGDNGCSRKFGMCGFADICKSSPRVRDVVLEREFQFNPWNPLEGDHNPDE